MKAIISRKFSLITYHFSLFTFHFSLITFHSSLFLLLLCTACSPQKRLERLVSHHPELRLVDTVMLHDTLTIPEVSADTAIALNRLSDTSVIREDRLEISLIKLRDTLHLKGRCKADTIIRTLSIPVERIKLIKTEPKGNVLSKFMWIAAGIIVVGMGLKILVRS